MGVFSVFGYYFTSFDHLFRIRGIVAIYLTVYTILLVYLHVFLEVFLDENTTFSSFLTIFDYFSTRNVLFRNFRVFSSKMLIEGGLLKIDLQNTVFDHFGRFWRFGGVKSVQNTILGVYFSVLG